MPDFVTWDGALISVYLLMLEGAIREFQGLEATLAEFF